jgi:hypothetical protein
MKNVLMDELGIWTGGNSRALVCSVTGPVGDGPDRWDAANQASARRFEHPDALNSDSGQHGDGGRGQPFIPRFWPKPFAPGSG